MGQNNFFADCNDSELVRLWQYYEEGNIVSRNSPFRPYLDKYGSTSSKMFLVLCEIDFLKVCAKRFFEKTLNEFVG